MDNSAGRTDAEASTDWPTPALVTGERRAAESRTSRAEMDGCRRRTTDGHIRGKAKSDWTGRSISKYLKME